MCYPFPLASNPPGAVSRAGTRVFSGSMLRTVLVSVLVLFVPTLASCSSDPAPSPTSDVSPATASTTSTTLAGTTSTSTTVAQPPEGTLHVGTAAPLESLDPADAVTLADWELILATSDGLLAQESGTGELTPGVAAGAPEISDDGLTYTFRLDPEARFSDGLALTAPLYAESLRRVMTIGGRASDLVSNFVREVDAPDDETVVIQLDRPLAFFPVLLAGAPYVPAHPGNFPPEGLEPLPEPPIHGVGEWFVAEMGEDRVVLERNPEAGREAGVESVVVHYFTSSEEMAAAMRDGGLDVVWRGVGPDLEATLGSVEGVTVARAPGGVLEFLVVNHDLEPTDDALVRRALATAVDREMVADELLDGALTPAFSPVPEGFLGSTQSFRDVYGGSDTEAAIDLLAEAGYSTDEPAQIELAYPPDQYGLHIAQAMEELERQLEATGLLDVTLTAQAWNTYVGEVVDGTYNAALLGWVYDFPDPHNYLAPFLLQGGMGGSGTGESEAMDEMVNLLDRAAVESDTEQRASLYARLQELYAEEVVTLPLWVDPEAVAYWDHVVADPEGPYPEALNIGPILRLDYGSLRLER